MLAEFSVAPAGSESMSDTVARCLDIVDRSGLDYQLTAMGTLLEGGWDEVFEVIRACHDAVRAGAPRVVTSVKIDDREGVDHALRSKVEDVEEALGRSLRK